MKIPHTSTADEQIDILADVLQNEFGGPTQSESAVEMAIRILRDNKNWREAMQSQENQLRLMTTTIVCSGRLGMFPDWDKPMTENQITNVVQDSVRIADIIHAKVIK